MRLKSFEGMACSIAGAMAAIGDRWGLVILRDLALGLTRYDDLRKSSGITNATLSNRLKHLEAQGLLERKPYQSNPERFDYLLTEKGRKFATIMPVLAEIGDAYEAAGTAAPPLTFVNRQTGAEVGWTLFDKSTGEPVANQDLAVQPGPGADELLLWRLAQSREEARSITVMQSPT